MGLLGNVAECPDLRTHFITDNYLNRLDILLRSNIDGIEGSYNACGILAHLISESDKYWNGIKTDRDRIHNNMIEAILSWSLDSKRNINYRSFVPIASLVCPTIKPAAQLWAVWALTNLCRICPEKYYPMLERDHVVEKMKELERDHRTISKVEGLISLCFDGYKKYLQRKGKNEYRLQELRSPAPEVFGHDQEMDFDDEPIIL